MTDVTDPQNYATKFENQLSKVRDAEIDERDREAILGFVRTLDATDEVNQGTLVSYINRLRLSAERADTPLVEWEFDDFEAFAFDLKHEHDLAEGTRRNYRKALRRFFEVRDVDFATDIPIGAQAASDVRPDELLTDEEIQRLLETPEKPRDKCLIALLADTGLRISAVASLRIRDLDLSGSAAFVSINEEANVKDASGTVPLTWSEGYVAGWLDVHPARDHADAPLMHKYRGYSDEGDNALDYQYLSRRIKEIADDAGVDREKVNTHNFRKSAVSRWIREGLSEQAIKHRACWSVDSDMLSVYSAVRDEELNDQILDHYDLGDGERASRPDLDRCRRCSTTLASEHEFCPGCGAPLTASAAETHDATKDAVVDRLVNEMDAENRSRLRTLLNRVEESPAAHEKSPSS